LVEVGSSVLNRAEELVQENVSIKTLDAIHVASLVTFQTAEGESPLSRVMAVNEKRRPISASMSSGWVSGTLLSSTSAFIWNPNIAKHFPITRELKYCQPTLRAGKEGLVVQPKPELDRHLPVIDLVVLNVAAALDDLEPVQVMQCLGCFGNRVLDCIFYTRFGSTGQLDLLINMLVHKTSLKAKMIRSLLW
jgi:hypothetical protein